LARPATGDKLHRMSAPFVKACVTGHPLSHTKSPLIHNHWIKKYGLSGEYDAVAIPAETLEDGVKRLVAEGYAGFNVTVPHKEKIFRLCEEIDETAKQIGAVNTVVIKDGKLYGYNTDAFGFIENVRQRAFGADFSRKPVAVLGAGGAARAVVYGLIEAGAEKIYLSNRTEERAAELKEMDVSKIEVVPWGKREEMLEGCGFLVNTTSLGMAGKEKLEMDLSLLPKEAIAADIVYAPLMTDLLKDVEARGNQIVTGIGMLLHQARPAFEKWFGVLPDIDAELERLVLS
jgi:shikimate dehydrogenase